MPIIQKATKALRRLRALLILAAIPTGNATTAANATLAPTGTLRAAYIVANVAQARHDAVTGTFTGVAADITRELGRKANVSVSIMPLPTAASVLEAVKNGSADIGFVAPNRDRSGVLFSQTYVLVQQSALVRADSPLVSVKDLDRPGRTIGVNTDDTVGVWLQQHLKFARVRATSDYTMQEPFRWLREGTVDAFAGGRQRLASRAGNEPQLRMLPDNLFGVAQSIAVPSNRPERLALINTALGAMREDGFLADSVRRSGIDGLVVARAEMPKP